MTKEQKKEMIQSALKTTEGRLSLANPLCDKIRNLIVEALIDEEIVWTDDYNITYQNEIEFSTLVFDNWNLIDFETLNDWIVRSGQEIVRQIREANLNFEDAYLKVIMLPADNDSTLDVGYVVIGIIRY